MNTIHLEEAQRGKRPSKSDNKKKSRKRAEKVISDAAKLLCDDFLDSEDAERYSDLLKTYAHALELRWKHKKEYPPGSSVHQRRRTNNVEDTKP